jgi:asparagine synthase (glutamine-hydrolysing)
VAAAKASAFRLSTFSAVFPGHEAFNEDEYQREVVRETEVDHHENPLSSKNFLDDLRALIWHIEQPLAGITIGQYQMARFTRKWVTVVLTGHGGDELFGGYPNHLIGHAIDRFKDGRNTLRAWRRMGEDLFHIARELSWVKIFYNVILFARPFPAIRKAVLKAYERRLSRTYFTREFRSRHPHHFTHKVVFELLQRSNARTWLDRMLYVDVKLWLHNILLVEDKESMAHSLEDRVPLLDNRILDFAEVIPSGVKITDLTLKAVMRKAESGKLPEALLQHKKMGFPQPVGEWFKEAPVAEQVRSMLSGGQLVKRRIVSSIFVQRLIEDHWSTHGDRSFDLWRLMCIEMWFSLFFPDSRDSSGRIADERPRAL